MEAVLRKGDVDGKVQCYIEKLGPIKERVQQEAKQQEANAEGSYRLLNFLKRKALGVGPYRDTSLFETGNRVFSDLVILFGVKRLLHELSGIFPFTEYKVHLGTQPGLDVKANQKGSSLAGEAFSVAKTYFQTKKASALKSLTGHDADYKLVLFNSDAVADCSKWDQKKIDGIWYVTVDVDRYVAELSPRDR